MEWMKVPIKDFPNYEISNEGEVWNAVTGKPILPRRNGAGYLIVSLYGGKIRKDMYIHRLVYEHFNGWIPPRRRLKHINGNVNDNRAENIKLLHPRVPKYHPKRRPTRAVICSMGQIWGSPALAADGYGFPPYEVRRCIENPGRDYRGIKFSWYDDMDDEYSESKYKRGWFL